MLKFAHSNFAKYLAFQWFVKKKGLRQQPEPF